MNAAELVSALNRGDVPEDVQAAIGFAVSFCVTAPDSMWQAFLLPKRLSDRLEEVSQCERYRSTLRTLGSKQ